MTYATGAIALSLFPPAMRQVVIDFVMENGNRAMAEANQCQFRGVKVDPALGFFKPSLPEEALINLARALRVILGDALAGQWDTPQYALALSRAGSIPIDEATRIASEHIVTKDASIVSFARRLLTALPDLPGPFDDPARSVLGGVASVLDMIPTDWVNSSADVLYEWFNLGEQIGRLAIRAALAKEEVMYEKQPVAPEDAAAAKDAALQTLPVLAKAIIGLLATKMETGDITDEDRAETGEILDEIGNLMVEGYHLTPEQGGFGSFLKRVGRVASRAVKAVGKVAAPLATFAGNAVLPGVGGIAAGILGSALKGGGNHAALTGAHARASQLPSAQIRDPGGRVTLGDLVRMTNQLRQAGVSIG